jgi:hypothetical protein
MNHEAKAQIMQGIADHIAPSGQHIYTVVDELCPRFSYCIGLSETTGLELIFAGGIRYMGREMMEIINFLCDQIRQEPDVISTEVEHPSLGRFSFGAVDPSWSSVMALGVHDYYRGKTVTFLQILPEEGERTIDIPDMSQPWDAAASPVWRWLKDDEPWPYPVPKSSTAVTDLATLKGARLCEVMRWEEGNWECFSGPGPDIPKEQMRVVPLGVLACSDPGLEAIAGLEVGHGLFREKGTDEWSPWVVRSSPP